MALSHQPIKIAEIVRSAPGRKPTNGAGYTGYFLDGKPEPAAGQGGSSQIQLKSVV
jgi:hypothetical protein